MRFKTIEMIGFKSFPDRTKVVFQPGITSIVGPNGCGKSNISDAIRWVLGEQSAKQIRGERMEDVIFNGTRSRAPMGMAEVTLVVTDLGAGISSDFAAFDEIQITRRYYRSGESEYLINRIPCRLADIRELFMDTGMGAKAYTIIGQGNISAVLNAKPKDRRFLFEEAAGISKYKARKDEALRKLDRTRENLSRVRDIIAEVNQQRNSLNRQAKKAERYKTYKDEIKEIDLHLSSLEYAAMSGEWKELEETYQNHKKRETELLAGSSSKETHIEELELEVLDREKRITELQDENRLIESDISRCENRIEVLSAETSHLSSLAEGSNREILRLQEEIAKNQSATAMLDEESASISGETEEKKHRLAEQETELSGLTSDQQQEESELETGKGRRSDLMQQIGIQKSRIENLVQQKESILKVAGGYDTNRMELTARLSETRKLLSEKMQQLSDLRKTMDEIRTEHDSIHTVLDQKQEALTAVQERFSLLREQIGQESSRFGTLVELQENLEGYDDGIRSLLHRKTDGDESGSLPEIHILVSEIFETDPMYETAIESAINNRYQSLVINSPEDSIKAVEYLKKNDIGRGSFIPLHPKNRKMDPFIMRDGTGVVGEALNLVQYNPQYAGVAEYLLGDVVVVESLEQAMALYRSNGFHRTLVTLNGDVLDPSGMVEGGSRKKNTSGFIRRKREIRELSISMDALRDQLAQAEEQRESLSREIGKTKQELGGIDARLSTIEAERVVLEKQASTLEGNAAHLSQQIEGLSHENQNRSSDLLMLEESMASSLHELRGMETDLEEKNAWIAACAERVQTLRERVDQGRRTITEGRIHLASLMERHASLLSHIEKNHDNLSNLNALIDARLHEIEESKGRILQAEEEKTRTETTIHSLIERKEALHSRVTQEQEAFESKRGNLQEEQKELKELRRNMENLNRLINDLEVRRTELSIRMEHLQSMIKERYQVSIQEVLPRFQDREIDKQTSEEHLAELNRKIEQMGPVNILAIEEYHALQKRFDFLTAQEADLQESVESLMTAIRKINHTSRERFEEAFDAINEKFKTAFTELFNGGYAELKLEEGEDTLEAGVEIIVQPPGKKLQHLSLLSGGEKALTVVALIFAGFLVKPSPFCLLDEVDAPLDDANVLRYNQMLSKMSMNTQFIAITHNKNSMEFASSLYGITMQEPGVSKMVSVRFNDNHEARMSA